MRYLFTTLSVIIQTTEQKFSKIFQESGKTGLKFLSLSNCFNLVNQPEA